MAAGVATLTEVLTPGGARTRRTNAASICESRLDDTFARHGVPMCVARDPDR
jgi:glutamate-1-semialdehyde aminotransferase